MVSIRSFFRAALAVMSSVIFLSACGGGGGSDTSSPTATPAQPAAPQTGPAASAPIFGAVALDKGTAFDGQPRKQVLAMVQGPAKPDIAFSYVPTAAKGTPTKVALAVRMAPPGATMPTAQIFTEAEKAYPTLLSPAHGELGVGPYGGRTYRFWCYAGTGNCLGEVISSSNPAEIGEIHGVGPFTNWETVRFETAAYWSCVFEPTRCGPRLVGAKAVNFSGETLVDLLAANPPAVTAKFWRLVLTYSETLDCTGVSGTSVIGGMLITVVCEGQTVTFTPGRPGEERWPMSTTNTLTVGGLRNADGYPSATENVTFVTRAAAYGQGAKVYTSNWFGKPPTVNAGNALSIYDVVTETLEKQVDYPDVPGYQVLSGQVAVDPVAGVVYQTSGSAQLIYRVDLEDGSVLTPIRIDPNSPLSMHSSRGLAVVGDEVCQVLGVPDYTGQTDYYLDNSLMCFNRHTLVSTFKGSRGHVADVSMITTGMHFVQGRGRLYVTNVPRSAYFLEQTPGGVRDGWQVGAVGTVTEIDAATKSVTRTFAVGSAPTSPFVDEQAGKLYVFNLGDKTTSVVDLTTGIATTTPLGMSGFERPTAVLPDWEKGRIYVSDGVNTIRVLNLALQETDRITLGDGDVAGEMVIVQEKLWVACPARDYSSKGDKVAIVNRNTLAVEKKITTRSASTDPDRQANMPYGIAAYAPPGL